MSQDELPSIDRSGIQSEVSVDTLDYAAAAGRRMQRTIDLLPQLVEPVLDMGPENALARQLGKRFGVQLQNTGSHDLDRESLSDFLPAKYATITSFEVLEHLLNPLFVLEGCRRVIQPDGRLLITVPKRNSWEWLFGKSPEHFHEFTMDEILWVIEKAGFQVVRQKEFNTSEMNLGLRPLLRRLIRNQLFLECTPA